MPHLTIEYTANVAGALDLPAALREINASLLATGRAVEHVLTLADLETAEAIWLGNSVRGLIRGEWIKTPGDPA